MAKTRQAIKKIVDQYRAVLEKFGIHAERVVLYGSFAQGKDRADSDIDLVVISQDFKGLNLRERLEILGKAAARVMKPIEARGYTPQEMKKTSSLSFLSEVLKVGVPI